MSCVVELRDLCFGYSKQDAFLLENINLSINRGEFIGIMGPSGSGKSTLLNIIAGIIPRTNGGNMTGRALLYGEDICKMKQNEICSRLGIVFQDPDTQLFTTSVQEDIAFGPENMCKTVCEIDSLIEQSLRVTGMGKYKHSSPNHLSGGQKQLIALAAVLAMEPDILALDEVMAYIDIKGRELIKKTLLDLKGQGKTIIMIDHDISNLDIADRVFIIDNKNLKEYQYDTYVKGRV